MLTRLYLVFICHKTGKKKGFYLAKNLPTFSYVSVFTLNTSCNGHRSANWWIASHIPPSDTANTNKYTGIL